MAIEDGITWSSGKSWKTMARRIIFFAGCAGRDQYQRWRRYWFLLRIQLFYEHQVMYLVQISRVCGRLLLDLWRKKLHSEHFQCLLYATSSFINHAPSYPSWYNGQQFVVEIESLLHLFEDVVRRSKIYLSRWVLCKCSLNCVWKIKINRKSIQNDEVAQRYGHVSYVFW
jgi:hypothetical protein